MAKFINIDNGGTLTDICVIDGNQVHRTKTLTTPHDLSRCLFDGLTKASKAIYGKEDLIALITSTDHIRYSTTQGTNALSNARVRAWASCSPVHCPPRSSRQTARLPSCSTP